MKTWWLARYMYIYLRIYRTLKRIRNEKQIGEEREGKIEEGV